MNRKHLPIVVFVALALSLGAIGVLAQGPQPMAVQAIPGYGFVYQGRLINNGVPVNGSCDVAFRLFDDQAAGAQVGGALTPTVSVGSGLFQTTLDFGANAFNGEARWLQMSVRCPAGSGAFAALLPRQAVAPAPYALALPGLRTTQSITAPNVIGGYSGNVISPTVYGATIAGGGRGPVSPNPALPNRITAGYGAVGGGLFNQAGDDAGTANSAYATVGGGSGNRATGWVSTVAGGGSNSADGVNSGVGAGYINHATGALSYVGGGWGNYASAIYALVGGGANNVSGDEYAVIAGGRNNIVLDTFGFIGGGITNSIQSPGDWAVIGGGALNVTGQNYAVIGGGYSNTVSAAYGTIAGGDNNAVHGLFGSIGGGLTNTIGLTASNAVIGGGRNNTAGASYATVGGGDLNRALGSESTVAGGVDNEASNIQAFIGGGEHNISAGNNSVVAGGNRNEAMAGGATIGGGDHNKALANDATVAGGYTNIVSATYGTIGGGNTNTVTAYAATIPGGERNIASGQYSFAAGSQARALHDGAFVWADNTVPPFASTVGQSFIVRAANGVGLGTNAPENQLHVVESIASTATPANHVAQIENSANSNTADVLALKIAYTGDPLSSNNYVTFFKGGTDVSVGSIEGNGSGGVTFAGPGNDYAEWLPRLDAGEVIQPGELVGVVNGRVTKQTRGASQIMAASAGAIVSGNDPGQDRRGAHTLIAFIGQAPVKVRGVVQAGDFIVPSGLNDGAGIAVAPEQITAAQYAQVVGQAWEMSTDAGVKLVRVAVGLARTDPTVSRLVAHTQAQAEALAGMQASVTALEARMAVLEKSTVAGVPDADWVGRNMPGFVALVAALAVVWAGRRRA
ncbi:MAG: hypothetical protein HZB53_07645 [Chloroflexi bacterium]|nr:hypothetical protein [Chloroflexota bacterium]